jgi:hypothetical protein
MKFFFLLCATLFVATSLFGQEYEIPKKATTIIVKTGLDKDENFSLIGEKLIENQVLLDKVEEAFGLVTTEPVQKGTLNPRTYVLTSPRRKVRSGCKGNMILPDSCQKDRFQ